MVAEYKKVKIWATDPLLPRDGTKRMLDLMVDGGIVKTQIPYEQIVNAVVRAEGHAIDQAMSGRETNPV